MGLTSSSRNEVWYLVSSFAAHTLKGEIDVDTAAIPSMQHLDATPRCNGAPGNNRGHS
jgi:hypothetical protein